MPRYKQTSTGTVDEDFAWLRRCAASRSLFLLLGGVAICLALFSSVAGRRSLTLVLCGRGVAL